MSYFGTDPGDLTPEDMYGTSRTTETHVCGQCTVPNGTIDIEWADENHTGCLFGCGSNVDPDTGICPHCHDHSANRVVCESCDRAYEHWTEQWALAT